MGGKLALTRSTKPDDDELFFFVEDSNGTIIPIKQTITKVKGGQVRMSIEAGDNVKVSRGELVNQG
jgi:hypothetical protein